MNIIIRWRCPVRTCKKSVSLRLGTFFETTKIPLRKFLILMYWWVRQYPVTQAAHECEVAKSTAVDVYQWLREICSWRLINHDDLTLGGTGPIHTNTVQIDESCFSHKPKVCTQCSNFLVLLIRFWFLK